MLPNGMHWQGCKPHVIWSSFEHRFKVILMTLSKQNSSTEPGALANGRISEADSRSNDTFWTIARHTVDHSIPTME